MSARSVGSSQGSTGRSLRLAVFGAAGQVGHALTRAASARGIDEVAAFPRAAVDITNAGAVAKALREAKPDAVVNAAAYTAVDRAESEPDAAYAVNRDGAAVVAEACASAGVDLVHLSTDYVFDGSRRDPYPPDAPLSPSGVYGSSKAAGERAVVEAHPQALIVRTSWVFGVHGHNFVRSIRRAAGTRDTLHVVDDQWGCPTPAAELAGALLRILEARRGSGADGTLRAGGSLPAGRVAHIRGGPPVTWCEFARAIVARLPDPRPEVLGVTTAEYGAPAPRPTYSVLDMSATTARWGIAPPCWEDALGAVLEGLDGVD